LVQPVTKADQTDFMTGDYKSISLTEGELRPVEARRLESELSALWHSAAKTGDTEHPVTRASVLTLLVYVESESAGVETLNLVAEIMHQNPCRAIVIIADRDAKPEGLTAAVSARCRVAPGGGKQVCCEQIAVRAHGQSVQGLGSVVVPLTIPGLPVYLWWRARSFVPPDFLRDVLRRTDRIVVDSGLFADPDTGLRDLARAVERFSGPHPVAFSDLNWSRLTAWRELIAQSFSSPVCLQLLPRVEEILIHWSEAGGYAQSGARGARAVLLAAWLAGRLGWRPASSSRRAHGIREIFFDAGSRTARVELRRKQGGAAEAPFSVQIMVAGGSPASFLFQESENGEKILTRVEAAGRPPSERSIQVPSMNEVRLIHEEIRHSGRDVIYEEALGFVARLATP
jgi:glucose-6-phosphate dehydrogenase assembly protein OpcA